MEDRFISAGLHPSKQLFADILLIARQIDIVPPVHFSLLIFFKWQTRAIYLEIFPHYRRRHLHHLAGRLAITMLHGYLASRDSPSFIHADRAAVAPVRPYICPSVCIALTTRLFGRTSMHPSLWPCARARSDRTRSRRVVSCPRGGWPNQRGRCTRAPGSAFTPPRLPLFLYTSSGQLRVHARARTSGQTYPPVNVLLPPSWCVTAALPPFSLSLLLFRPRFLIIILFLPFPPHPSPPRPTLLPPASPSLLSYVLSISLKPRLCSWVQKKL